MADFGFAQERPWFVRVIWSCEMVVVMIAVGFGIVNLKVHGRAHRWIRLLFCFPMVNGHG
jgi:hypothetical protein